MESKEKISHLEEHYLGLSDQGEINLPYFVMQKYRVIEKLVKFNGFYCVFFDKILILCVLFFLFQHECILHRLPFKSDAIKGIVSSVVLLEAGLGLEANFERPWPWPGTRTLSSRPWPWPRVKGHR